jgi:hypothetical protein
MADATSATKVIQKIRQAIRRAFLSNPIALATVLACVFIAAICLAIGFQIDAKSMSVNVLAGLVCIALGIPIAIWIVDRYLKHIARRRWSRVDTLTYRAIAAHLCDSAVEILIGIDVLNDLRPMAPIQEGRDRPDPQTIEGLTALAKLLRAVPNPANNDLSDAAIECYKASKWDLDQLCDSLLPRVIEYSDEQDLIDALIELDTVRRTLHNSMIAHEQIVTGGVFHHLPELVDASKQVYRALLNHWKPAS